MERLRQSEWRNFEIRTKEILNSHSSPLRAIESEARKIAGVHYIEKIIVNVGGRHLRCTVHYHKSLEAYCRAVGGKYTDYPEPMCIYQDSTPKIKFRFVD